VALIERQRILGIDPGSRLTGFGLVDFESGRAHYVASGSINSCDGSFAERLQQIFRSMAEIVTEYRPQVVAIESVYQDESAVYLARLWGSPPHGSVGLSSHVVLDCVAVAC
jgi:crossover junction endodeoxyribonuclease RuvC